MNFSARSLRHNRRPHWRWRWWAPKQVTSKEVPSAYRWLGGEVPTSTSTRTSRYATLWPNPLVMATHVEAGGEVASGHHDSHMVISITER